MVGRKRLPVKLCCQNKIYSRLPEDEVQLSLFKSKLWGGFNIETSEPTTNSLNVRFVNFHESHTKKYKKPTVWSNIS